MATPYKSIFLPTVGGSSGTWGTELNTQSLVTIDNNLGGIVTKTLTSSNVSLSATESEAVTLRLTGTLTGAVQVTTSCQGFTIVENLTTGSYDLTLTNGVGSAVSIPSGRSIFFFDATNGSRIVAGAQYLNVSGSGVIKRSSTGVLSTDAGTTAIIMSKDNNGIQLSTGIHGDITVPFDATINGVTLLADQAGSMVVDIWKDSYANYPPTIADTITASAKPTLSSATKYTDTSLTGWTTSISAGDVLRINVDSVTTITRYTLAIYVSRY